MQATLLSLKRKRCNGQSYEILSETQGSSGPSRRSRSCRTYGSSQCMSLGLAWAAELRVVRIGRRADTLGPPIAGLTAPLRVARPAVLRFALAVP